MNARAVDEIYILVYINNGAATNAENLNPGKGIARQVKLTTEIDDTPAATHYVKVRFAGANTNTVINSFKIMTGAQESLKVVPQSGEIYDYKGAEAKVKNLEVGNNTILIGDIPPKFESSLFIRFKVKVENALFGINDNLPLENRLQ